MGVGVAVGLSEQRGVRPDGPVDEEVATEAVCGRLGLQSTGVLGVGDGFAPVSTDLDGVVEVGQ